MPSLAQDLKLMLLYVRNDSDLDCSYVTKREKAQVKEREIKMPYQQIKVS